MIPHPIRLLLSDDLRRSRPTVFFRLLLAIPHLIWLLLWSVAALVAAVANWVATLVSGRSPNPLHGFLAAYVRYVTHVNAYVALAAEPFPGFTGAPGSYPVDVEIAGPQPQNRWITGFRLPLAVPAIVLAGVLGGGAAGVQLGGAGVGYSYSGGLLASAALLAWFASLARARIPSGLRNGEAYALSYSAQVAGYLLMLTDRYPDSDPLATPAGAPLPGHPVDLTVNPDLGRSRLTVFFRVLLVIPHLIWLYLWAIAAALVTVVNWFATLFTGRSPDPLHGFLAAYVRYQANVLAFWMLIAEPFPAFVPGSEPYAVDLRIAPSAPQNRWITGFRLALAIPAVVVSNSLTSALTVAAFLGWFAALALGRMPRGLRNFGAFAIRYQAQLSAYVYVLTDRYPYSSPGLEPLGAVEPPSAAAPAPARSRQAPPRRHPRPSTTGSPHGGDRLRAPAWP